MYCGDLNGKDIQKGGIYVQVWKKVEVLISQCPTCCDSTDCIRTADSSCLTVERNTSLLKQLHCLAAKSCLTFLRSHELQPTRLLCPWDFPGKNTGVGCCSLLQGIFPTQESNSSLLHFLYWQVNSLPLSYQRSPKVMILKKKKKFFFFKKGKKKFYLFEMCFINYLGLFACMFISVIH